MSRDARTAVRAAGAGDGSVASAKRFRGVVAELDPPGDAAEAARVVGQVAACRARAEDKLPALAGTLVSDREGLEMASSEVAACWKAARFAERLGSGARVIDLCSGIGADAWAFARAGLDVTAVEMDPVRAWMTERNARCRGVVGDAGDLAGLKTLGKFDAVHIDPARRAADPRAAIGRRGVKRARSLDDLEPGWPRVAALVTHFEHACVKLAPSVDPEELPAGEVEYVSDRSAGKRRLTQAVLWTGRLAGENRVRATRLLDGGKARTVVGEPGAGSGVVYADEFKDGDVVLSVDPAVERARLMGVLGDELGARVLDDAGTGLLVCDEVKQDPFVRSWRVLAVQPFHERRIGSRLRELGAGIVTVKTRGGVGKAEKLSKAWRGDGARDVTVFCFVLGGVASAVVAEAAG